MKTKKRFKVTVAEARKAVPKLVKALHTNQVSVSAHDADRIKNMWRSHPPGWPEHVPYIDPNNRKNGKYTSRASRAQLMQMYDYLTKRLGIPEMGKNCLNNGEIKGQCEENNAEQRKEYQRKKCVTLGEGQRSSIKDKVKAWALDAITESIDNINEEKMRELTTLYESSHTENKNANIEIRIETKSLVVVICNKNLCQDQEKGKSHVCNKINDKDSDPVIKEICNIVLSMEADPPVTLTDSWITECDVMCVDHTNEADYEEKKKRYEKSSKNKNERKNSDSSDSSTESDFCVSPEIVNSMKSNYNNGKNLKRELFFQNKHMDRQSEKTSKRMNSIPLKLSLDINLAKQTVEAGFASPGIQISPNPNGISLSFEKIPMSEGCEASAMTQSPSSYLQASSSNWMNSESVMDLRHLFCSGSRVDNLSTAVGWDACPSTQLRDVIEVGKEPDLTYLCHKYGVIDVLQTLDMEL